jgi:hypothetical protein
LRGLPDAGLEAGERRRRAAADAGGLVSTSRRIAATGARKTDSCHARERDLSGSHASRLLTQAPHPASPRKEAGRGARKPQSSTDARLTPSRGRPLSHAGRRPLSPPLCRERGGEGRGDWPAGLFLCDRALERARLACARIEAFAPLNRLVADNRRRRLAPTPPRRRGCGKRFAAKGLIRDVTQARAARVVLYGRWSRP